MAHEILIEDGKASMFYVGEVPWHRLGTRLKVPPETAADAMEAAGLSWSVSRVPLYVSGFGRLIQVPNRFAVIRADHIDRDDCPVFGVVGADYEPLQNREAFEFFDPIVGARAAEYHTAGALGRGERVWVLVKLRLQDPLMVGPDRIEPYVLLANTHDGTGSITIKLTPVRVVCQNTLTVALRRDGRAWRIRHTKSMSRQLEHTQADIEHILATFRELTNLFERLRTIRITDAQARDFFFDVFPVPRDASQQSTDLATRHRAAAQHLFRHGAGNDVQGVKETLWAAYNGVTEYIDHRKPNRMAKDYSDTRLAYTWFGGGSAAKQRALQAAANRLNPRPRLEHLALRLT